MVTPNIVTQVFSLLKVRRAWAATQKIYVQDTCMCIMHICSIKLKVSYTHRYTCRVQTDQIAVQIFIAHMLPTTKLAC